MWIGLLIVMVKHRILVGTLEANWCESHMIKKKKNRLWNCDSCGIKILPGKAPADQLLDHAV